MIGKIIGLAVTAAVGIILTVLGILLLKKEMIGLIHDYHSEKVSEENKKAFCALSGAGIIVIGLSLLITAAVYGVTDSLLSFVCFAAGVAAGVALLIIAVSKYNR